MQRYVRPGSVEGQTDVMTHTSLKRGADANDWKVLKLSDFARITLFNGDPLLSSGENTLPLLDEEVQIQSSNHQPQNQQSSGSIHSAATLPSSSTTKAKSYLVIRTPHPSVAEQDRRPIAVWYGRFRV